MFRMQHLFIATEMSMILYYMNNRNNLFFYLSFNLDIKVTKVTLESANYPKGFWHSRILLFYYLQLLNTFLNKEEFHKHFLI